MVERDDRFSGRKDGERWRSPSERDLDRILYASAYRRLAGVTQVLPAGEYPYMHNRLTHTLKVQQVAMRTAQYLLSTTAATLLEKAGGLDPVTCAAAGAAHDLGHPPFGHIAEDEFQDILTCGSETGAPWLPDSFEGNAQSFRIVTKLSIRKPDTSSNIQTQPDYYGLDLTYSTLSAILKYPWCRKEHESRGVLPDAQEYYSRKWGAYESERGILDEALQTIPDGRPRSLEAEIMDHADDVTYAIHDIEDFFRLGLIPLHEIGLAFQDVHHASRTRSKVAEDFWDFAAAEINAKGEVAFNPKTARERLSALAYLMPDLPYQDTDADRLALHKFISSAVNTLQNGITIGPTGQFREGEGNRMLIEVLKQLTWFFVIEHPALAASQQGQRRLIRDLVTWLVAWATENESEDLADLDKKRKIDRRRERELPGRLLSLLAIAKHDSENMEHPYDPAQRRLRAVVDFISGMTEAEAYEMHSRLGGSESTSLIFSMPR